MEDKSRFPFFTSELHASAWPVSGAMFAFCSVAALFTSTQRPIITPFAATFAICFALELRRPKVGKLATVATLGAFIAWAANHFAAPDLLALLVAPVLLAGAALGLPVALLTALASSGWIVWTSVEIGGPLVWPIAGLALALVWIAFAALLLIYQPVYAFADWAWGYYDRTQRQLTEAEQRKLTLEQVTAELFHANEQLTRMNVLAQRLHLAAEEARAAKQQFVANVSHELRTPLNMIIGFSEMILDAPETYGNHIPATLMADLAVIRRNASHLAELVNDVLDLSQIEADQMTLYREYVAFSEILESAVIGVRPLYESKGLYLRTDLPDDLPLIFCDATRIREVLLNLLSNAGRFTDDGGVIVSALREGDHLVVTVEDTGLGIGAQDLDRLFKPFSQLDASLSRRHTGTGLGLSISRQFIEMHEGRMWVASQIGTGTTFYFQLPISPAAASPESAARWLEPNWEYVERVARPEIIRPELRPRYVVFDRNGALLNLLDHSYKTAEVIPVTDVAEARQLLAEKSGDLFLLNDVSVDAGLDCLNAQGGPPPAMPTLICAIAGSQRAPETRGATVRLVKPILRETLLEALTNVGVESGMVLIVDDEPDALQLFGRLLISAEGSYRVLVAQTGLEALRILRDHQPDAILLDLVMPHMDGFQLLAALQNDPALRSVPVIIISARDPAGAPIISSGLAIAHPEGVSARHLLAAIQFTARLFSPGPITDPESPAASRGSPAS